MQTTNKAQSWLDQPVFRDLTINRETLIFGLILILAVVTRFYDLGARVMSHDENSHVYYSWQLSRGGGYIHTPLTHGPFQFHVVALSYFLFGDSDFTARIPAALFGVAVIAFLWNYRRYLGRAGTLIAAGMMLISPFMLFYARYVRNDIFVAFFGVVMLWAVLRFLETGEARYTYWLTAAAVLHYVTKETSFIYSAQLLLFLGLLFVAQVTRQKWPRPEQRTRFVAMLILAAALIVVALGLKAYMPLPGAAGGEAGEAAAGTLPLSLIVPLGLAGAALVGALIFAITGLTWAGLKQNRAFSLMLLHLTIILPQLAPFPVKALGWNPLDYSAEGMLRTGIFVFVLAAISVVVGLAWDAQTWLMNAAIFYIPFTVLYTTVFTNGSGFFTGLVGSLGYWLEQQGVERGSQPWYYYILVQVPVYEFLPLLGSFLTGLIVVFRKRWGSLRVAESAASGGEPTVEHTPPILPLLGFWAVTSILAYTIAGEKMPWLTVHIAYPLILLAAWGLGQLVERGARDVAQPESAFPGEGVGSAQSHQFLCAGDGDGWGGAGGPQQAC